jgi:hypothetical protein
MANGIPARERVRRTTITPRRVLLPIEPLKSTSQLSLDGIHFAALMKQLVASACPVVALGALKGLQAGTRRIGVLILL